MDAFTYLSVFPESCSFPWQERSDCGYSGISKEQCLDKGCCYDDTIDRTLAPYCFFNKIGKLIILDL